jgi:dTDP-4-dehydrorhamnose reductase
LFGASGAFGTAFEALCLQRNHTLLALSGKDLDITDNDALRKAFDEFSPEVVVNSVAIVGINPCEADPVRAFAVNTIPVHTMALLCGERNITLVQPSTHAVFDGLKQLPYYEEDLPDPRNIYAMSKYAAEKIAYYYTTRHYVVRFPTLFGERRNTSFGFCDKVIMWLREGREIKIAEDKIDSPTFTRDAARQVLSLLEDERPYGLYHIANQGSVSYYTLACRIASILGNPSRITPVSDADFPSPAFKPLRTALASNRLVPMRAWDDALVEYLAETASTIS